MWPFLCQKHSIWLDKLVKTEAVLSLHMSYTTHSRSWATMSMPTSNSLLRSVHWSQRPSKKEGWTLNTVRNGSGLINDVFSIYTINFFFSGDGRAYFSIANLASICTLLISSEHPMSLDHQIAKLLWEYWPLLADIQQLSDTIQSHSTFQLMKKNKKKRLCESYDRVNCWECRELSGSSC